MTDKIVMIPVEAVTLKGKPTCRGCVFEFETYDRDLGYGYQCTLEVENRFGDRTPSTLCPVHSAGALARMKEDLGLPNE